MLDNDTTAHELSIGRMPTDRPSRYGKQIVSHLTRRATGQWSDETNAGTITFEDGAVVPNSRVNLTHSPSPCGAPVIWCPRSKP